MQRSDDPKAGMLGAPVPHAMTTRCKAVRHGSCCDALGAPTRGEVDVAALKKTMS